MTGSTRKPLKRSVIKEELVALTGDLIRAVILNQFIYWSERIADIDKYIEEEKRRCSNDGQEATIYPTEGWIYKTAEELAEETMLGKAPSSMRIHITYLVEHGWLLERTNPIHKWDRTKQYRINMPKLQMDLNSLGYTLEGYGIPFFKTENAFLKIENGDFKIKNQTFENERAIPEITTEITYRENNNDDNNNDTITQILDDTKNPKQLPEQPPTREKQLPFSKHDFEDELKNEFAWKDMPISSSVPNNLFSSPSESEIAATSAKPFEVMEEQQPIPDNDPYIQVDNRMSQHLGRIYNAKQDDYRAIKQLLESQVPLDFILAGIDYTFANFSDRKINSFGYCAKVITQQWAREMVKHEDVKPIDWREAMETEGNFQRPSSSRVQLPVTERQDKYEAFYNLFPG